MTFYDQLMASFPAHLQPPDELVRYFKWVQAQGCAHVGGKHVYANTDPAMTDSQVALEPVRPDQARHWLGQTDPAITNRLAAFCRTGGDGSCAALWCDEQGAVRIVHMGSGSGSVMVGVLTATPVDFLRLLAVGYDELCWYDNLDLTPAQVFEQEQEDDPLEGKALAQPVALRAWLQAEFGVDVPATADELIGELPDMDRDPDSTDPFYQWLSKLKGLEDADEDGLHSRNEGGDDEESKS